MKKIIIVIPKPNYHNYNTPLEYGYIGACLLKAGFNAEIWDKNAECFSWHNFRKRLSVQKNNISIVVTGSGFRFYNPCSPFTICEAVEITRITKEVDNRIKVLIVGPFSSLYPEYSFSRVNADFIVRGDPEIVTTTLAGSILDGGGFSEIKGISYKIDGKVVNNQKAEYADINKIPYPARNLLRMGAYINDYYFSSRVTNILSSRGCPFSCNFCFIAKGSELSEINYGNPYRAANPEHVIGEIKELTGGYGIKGLRFVDPEFCFDKERVKAICTFLIKEKLDYLKWQCQTRVDVIDEELLRTMKEAGCAAIYYGVETGNKEMLQIMGKGHNLDKIREVFSITKKHGILANAYFLLGVPGETAQSMKDTIEFSGKINADFALFHNFVPYPGIKLLNGKKNLEAIEKMDPYFMRDNYPDRGFLSSEGLEKYRRKAYRRFYFNLKYFIHFFATFKTMQDYVNIYRFLIGKKTGLFMRKLLFSLISKKKHK